MKIALYAPWGWGGVVHSHTLPILLSTTIWCYFFSYQNTNIRTLWRSRNSGNHLDFFYMFIIAQPLLFYPQKNPRDGQNCLPQFTNGETEGHRHRGTSWKAQKYSSRADQKRSGCEGSGAYMMENQEESNVTNTKLGTALWKAPVQRRGLKLSTLFTVRQFTARQQSMALKCNVYRVCGALC